jgi:DNA-binding PadR family transcriptional regulator
MTNAELAILSLIAERPRYGYEIDETIEARGMRGWTDIGFSSIYYLLKKLTGDGLLVQETRESEHGPARKVYSVTQAGITALRTGTTDALTNLDGGERDFLLGLANLPALSWTPCAQGWPIWVIVAKGSPWRRQRSSRCLSMSMRYSITASSASILRSNG